MSVIDAETKMQPTPEQPNYTLRRIKVAVIAGATLLSSIVGPRVFGGDAAPQQSPVAGEGDGSDVEYGVSVEDKLSDMGLEHQEGVDVEKEFTPEEELKTNTYFAWRKPKGSDAPYSLAALANYISVEDESGEKHNVFSMAEHFITTDEQGDETGVLDRYADPNQYVKPMDASEVVKWDVVVDEAGKDPNITEPLATIDKMIVNVGKKDSDLLLGVPANTSPRLSNIEPQPFLDKAPKPGAKTIVVRVNSERQLEVYEGVYLGQGLYGPQSLSVERVLVQAKIGGDGSGRSNVDPNLRWTGSSGASAWTIDEKGRPSAVLVPQRHAINKGAINGNTFTERELLEDLNITRLQDESRILSNEDNLTEQTVLQFGQAGDLVPSLANAIS